MKSWRTTVTGILTILVAVAAAGKAFFDGDPSTVPNWEAVIAAVIAGVGLISARDNKVSSEEAGIK